jgi:DNA-binding GntR family transcriptional regulator
MWGWRQIPRYVPCLQVDNFYCDCRTIIPDSLGHENDRAEKINVVNIQTPAANLRESEHLGRLRAPTFVDHVVDAIVSRAALGKFLPGGRINELALARELGISRAPIREALRTLIAQGVLESVPYQGARLAAMTHERVQQINEVRFELEKLALRKISSDAHEEALLDSLTGIVEDMKVAARKKDRLAIVTLDADFHEAMVRAANNPVLLKFWQTLRPQLIIMFGIRSQSKPFGRTVEEHRRIVTELRTRKIKDIESTLAEHILEDNKAVANVRANAKRAQSNSQRLNNKRHV